MNKNDDRYIKKLRNDNMRLQRQIDWLISEIKYASAHPPKEWAKFGLCPSCSHEIEGCEYTYYDGFNDRPDCEKCWRENAYKAAE